MAFTTNKDIDHRFAFHAAPNAEKRMEHTSIRALVKELAIEMNERLPEGREKAIVLTKLEEVMFWGNAAIARDNK